MFPFQVDCSFHPSASFLWGWDLSRWIWLTWAYRKKAPVLKETEHWFLQPQTLDHWERWMIGNEEDKLDTKSWNSPQTNNLDYWIIEMSHTVFNNSFWNLNFTVIFKTKQIFIKCCPEEKKVEPVPLCCVLPAKQSCELQAKTFLIFFKLQLQVVVDLPRQTQSLLG